MALNVKVGLIGLLDMLKFANLGKKREKIIANAPAEEITANYPVNNIAKALHPDYQTLVIDEIIDHGAAAAKTFVLRRADGKAAPYFRAGQYISLKLPIGKSFVTRPYSISSAPRTASSSRASSTPSLPRPARSTSSMSSPTRRRKALSTASSPPSSSANTPAKSPTAYL